jgi:uroporphyrinogen decarboxylase
LSHRFLQACLGHRVDRPPVWIMRQAGRYLPEYRAVREKVDFLALCKSPELLCEVTLQPLRRFELDAAILFSDIMVPLEGMGVEMDFDPGPVLSEPVRSRAQVEALRVPEPQESVPYVLEGIRLLRRELGERAPLIGFAGAPYTLATYLAEGSGAKQFTWIGRLLAADEPTGMLLLEKLTETVASYVLAQIDAGAQAIQLFDSWAGNLSLDGWRRHSLPFVREILRRIEGRVPTIYFARGCSAFLPELRDAGADVLGLDWQLPIGEARARLGAQPVQGNLDPLALYGPEPLVRRETRAVLDGAGGLGHVFNLGHGILPDTPIAAVEWMLDEIAAWKGAPREGGPEAAGSAPPSSGDG